MIRFGQLLGAHPVHGGNYFDTVLAVAQASERAGLDAVFYSDHVQMQRHSAWVRGHPAVGQAARPLAPAAIHAHLAGRVGLCAE